MDTPDGSELRVLVLAPLGRDAVLVGETLREAGIACRGCSDLEVLRLEIEEGAGAVVVTEDVLGLDAVDALADMFRGQLPWSDLPLLIFSSGRDGEAHAALEGLRKLTSYTLI